VELIKKSTGKRIDLSRIDFEDKAVYDMLCKGDTIGIFPGRIGGADADNYPACVAQSADMAHEVACRASGVGVNNGVQEYLLRRLKKKPVAYDHLLEKRALERTLGIILFQDQVNQLAIDVAGFNPIKPTRCAALSAADTMMN